MDASGAELTASLAASPGAAEHEGDGGQLEPTPATPRGAEPPSGGSTPASAEKVVESPSGVGRRTGREPPARPRRSAGANPGKELLDEISALKEQQKKASKEKGNRARIAKRPSSWPDVEEESDSFERCRSLGCHLASQS